MSSRTGVVKQEASIAKHRALFSFKYLQLFHLQMAVGTITDCSDDGSADSSYKPKKTKKRKLL